MENVSTWVPTVGLAKPADPNFGQSALQGDYASGQVLIGFAPHPDGLRPSRND